MDRLVRPLVDAENHGRLTERPSFGEAGFFTPFLRVSSVVISSPSSHNGTKKQRGGAKLYENQMYPQWQSQMPNVRQQTWGQPQNNLTGQPGFDCRPVTSREEAVATQVSFVGPGTILPDLGHGKIWLKRFNPNTGSSELYEFAAVQPDPKPELSFASASEMETIKRSIQQIQDDIERLKKSGGRGAKKNEPDE